MNPAAAAGLGVAIVLILLLLRWKLRTLSTKRWRKRKHGTFLRLQSEELEEENCQPYPPAQMVHRLCPHHNVVQRFQVEEKDSLDEHLDVLTRKLAEKEGRLRLSKSKIRQTQNEIENLHAIDQDVRSRYREIMESLRTDLLSNEKECKKLQEQIEWVSQRRAELKDEVAAFNRAAKEMEKSLNEEFKDVRRGQRLYGEAAAELASNLAELQRGRVPEHRITDKPQRQSSLTSLRHRKEPQLPRATPEGSIIIKNSPPLSPLHISQGELFE